MSELNILIELLSIVDEEKLDCEIAEDLAEKIAWDQLNEINNVYSNLFHYWHDEDIRFKDLEYSNMQNSELKKLIKYLKNGEFEKANSISFLGASNS